MLVLFSVGKTEEAPISHGYEDWTEATGEFRAEGNVITSRN